MTKPAKTSDPTPASPATGGAWERLPDGTLRPAEIPQNHADDGTLSDLQQAAEAALKPLGKEA